MQASLRRETGPRPQFLPQTQTLGSSQDLSQEENRTEVSGAAAPGCGILPKNVAYAAAVNTQEGNAHILAPFVTDHSHRKGHPQGVWAGCPDGHLEPLLLSRWFSKGSPVVLQLSAVRRHLLPFKRQNQEAVLNPSLMFDFINKAPQQVPTRFPQPPDGPARIRVTHYCLLQDPFHSRL